MDISLPKGLPENLIAAIMTSTIYILGAYSFSSLIFYGPIAHFLTYGFNIIIISNIIACLYSFRFGKFSILSSLTQTSDLAIFALISTALMTSKAFSANQLNPIYTVYAAMIFLSFFAGAILWLLGKFRMGNVVRFIPYPVIVAFLAASGWILIDYAIKLMLGSQFTLLQLNLINKSLLIQVALSLSIILMIVFLQKQNWIKRIYIEPVVYLSAIGIFYLIIFFNNISLEMLKSHGWYIKVERLSEFSYPWHLISIRDIQWSAFCNWSMLGNMLAIFIITPIFLLLTLNGIERDTQYEFNYNKELKDSGMMNMLLPIAGGGALVSAALSATQRNHVLKANSRWLNIYLASFFTLALIFGTLIIEVIPLFVVASLPLMSGVSLIRNWLFASKNKLSNLDYILLWFVFLIIIFQGFLTGIFLGFVAALLAFDYRYSRITTVRNELSGMDLHSDTERGMAAETWLKKLRSGIYIIILQGYLFFGNINTLIDQLISRIHANDKDKLYFIILDFRNTQGMDPSSAESFFRLYKHAQAHQIIVIFTHLSNHLFQNMLSFLNLDSKDKVFLKFNTLNSGLNWCEEQLLEKITLNWKTYFSGQLYLIFPDEMDLKLFIEYLDLLEVQKDIVVFDEKQRLEGIYFLDKGSMDLIYTDEKFHNSKIKTIYPGVFIGENSLYLNEEQMFSCRTNSPCSLYYLSFDNLIRMENENPKLALTFHRYMVIQMLNKLSSSHQTSVSLV